MKGLVLGVLFFSTLCQAADTVKPTVSIAKPFNGQVITSFVPILAQAKDNVGIAQVQFLIDGKQYKNVELQAPYQIELAPKDFQPGLHVIKAIAKDTSGNTATSVPVTVRISLPPIPTPSPSPSPVPSPSPSPSPSPVPSPTPSPSASPVVLDGYEDETCQGLDLPQYPKDKEGYSILPRLPLGRMIYVTAKGGQSDPTKNIYFVKTPAEGAALLRKGQPDELLFARGESFSSLSLKGLGGISFDAPMIIGAYGVGPRPVIKSGTYLGNQTYHDLAIVDLHFKGNYSSDGIVIQATQPRSNLLFENLEIEGFINGMVLMNGMLETDPGNTNVVVRRNFIHHNYSRSHSQGVYADGNRGFLLEENHFYRNGFGPNRSGQGFETGNATVYAHNVYVQSNDRCVKMIGNISAEPAATGFQMRAGGVVDSNFIFHAPVSFTWGLVNGGSVTAHHIVPGLTGRIVRNVVLDGSDISPSPSDQREGRFDAGNAKKLLISDNLFMNHVRGPAIGVAFAPAARMGIGIHNLSVINNSFVNLRIGIAPEGPAWKTITLKKDGSVVNSKGQVLLDPDTTGIPPQPKDVVYDDLGSLIGPNVFSSVQNPGQGNPNLTWATQLTNPPLFDSTRTLGTYLGSPTLSNGDAMNEIVSEWATGMDKGSWNAKWTASSISKYLRDGFKAK